MEILSSFVVFFIITHIEPGAALTVRGSLKAIGDTANNAAASVVKAVVDKVRDVAEVSATVSQKVHDDSAFGKIRKGAYDIKKGLVTGADEVVGTPVDLKELKFYLVTAKNVDNPKNIDFFKPKDIAQTDGKIIFLVHGWKSGNNTWFRDLSEIFVRKYPDTHMVQVHWTGPANDFYPFSAFATESVGNYVGILINRLVANYNVSVENIILIGHSLGAHVSGFSAKMFTKITGRKLPRIIALDPAGPLFILRPNSRRLNKNDADVVMAIHTDAGALGYPTIIGTIDFFPNGGDNQPGCWKKLKVINLSTYAKPVSCDHSRSWEFFTEAVNVTGSFPARKCNSYNDFENDKCEDEVVTMGDLETNATGSFFLKTNAKKPFSRSLIQQKKTKRE